MQAGARGIACMDALHDADGDRFEGIASRIREDGRWIDAGENDNAIVQTLVNTPDAFGVFILPPSEDELLERLRARKREDESVIQRRFAAAREEIARAKNNGAYDAFITNDNLDRAIEEALIVIRTERERRSGKQEPGARAPGT